MENNNFQFSARNTSVQRFHVITQPPQQQAMDTGVITAELWSNEDLPSLIINSTEKDEPFQSVREQE